VVNNDIGCAKTVVVLGQLRTSGWIPRPKARRSIEALASQTSGFHSALIRGFHRFQRPRTISASVRMLLDGGGRWWQRSPRSRLAYAARTWPARNWRCRLGEIDIVAAEAAPTGLTLVFCEVKCRGLGFGHPLEAITYTKMRTLRQLAALWMREHRMRASSIRLDAIGVVLQPGREPSLTHVRAVG
jgi:putative endonuclease